MKEEKNANEMCVYMWEREREKEEIKREEREKKVYGGWGQEPVLNVGPRGRWQGWWKKKKKKLKKMGSQESLDLPFIR